MVRLSRRKLADRAVSRLLRGDKASAVMTEQAAYLIQSKRMSEADLIVRDIESGLARNGVVVATVTSARSLNDEVKMSLEKLLKTEYGSKSSVYFQEIIDESVIGGVKMETPDKQLDTTIKAKLDRLSA